MASRLRATLAFGALTFFYKFRKPSALVPPRILILAHRRSGSSLFSHLLLNDEKVWGMGETGVKYKGADYPAKIRARISVFTKKIVPSDAIVLDKIVDGNLLPDPGVVGSKKTVVIFFIRTPHEALKSMRQHFTGHGAEEDVRYYLRQLKWLESCAVSLSGKVQALFFDYSELVGRGSEVFRLISERLGEPLCYTGEYKIHPFTGKWGPGDGGDNIGSGVVKRIEYPASLTIPQDLMQPCERAFKECEAVLRTHCSSLERENGIRQLENR